MGVQMFVHAHIRVYVAAVMLLAASSYLHMQGYGLSHIYMSGWSSTHVRVPVRRPDVTRCMVEGGGGGGVLIGVCVYVYAVLVIVGPRTVTSDGQRQHWSLVTIVRWPELATTGLVILVIVGDQR